MSRPFSSTFDALQAHFTHRQGQGARTPPAQVQGSSPGKGSGNLAQISRSNTDENHASNTAAGTHNSVPSPGPNCSSIQESQPLGLQPLPRWEPTSMPPPLRPSISRELGHQPIQPMLPPAPLIVPPSTTSTQALGVPSSHISADTHPSIGVPRNDETLPQQQISTDGPNNPQNTATLQVAAIEDEVDPMDITTDALLERQNQLNEEDPLPKVSSVRGFSRKHFLPKDKPPRSTRESRGGRARKKRGHRKAAEPTGDIKYRLTMASSAYMEGRLDEAAKWVLEAIRINAETHRAWVLLASIVQEQGDQKGYYTAKHYAARLQPQDIDGWLQCAEIAVGNRDEFPEDERYWLQEAKNHYSAAIRLDPNHNPARHGRAAVQLELGFPRLAVKDYIYLVEHCNFDIYALRGFAESCVLIAEIGKSAVGTRPEVAIEAYRRCITHLRENSFDSRYPFDWEDVKIFVELLAYVEQFRDAIHELRSLSRWLLARSDEAFWDSQDDDREWDVDNTRRLEVKDYQDGKYPASSYSSGLPIEFRTKLGVYRLKLGQEDEAMHHLQFIDPNVLERLSEHSDLVMEAASALYEAGNMTMALHFYEPLRTADLIDAESLVRAGRCYLNAGDKKEAEECFTTAIDQDEPNSAACIDARYELAQMYEAAREEREAYILVNEAIRLQEARERAHEEEEKRRGDNDKDDQEDDDGAPSAPLQGPGAEKDVEAIIKRSKRPLKPKGERPEPKPKEPKPKAQPKPAVRRRKLFAGTAELQEQEKRRSSELVEAWKVVRASRASAEVDADGPSNAFMSAARELVDDFRSYKDFYTWDKFLAHLGVDQAREKIEARKANPNLLAMAERLSHNLNPEGSDAEKQPRQIAVSYRGVPFDDWLDLFLEYALALAQTGRFEDAYKVCENARDTTIFSKSKQDLFLINVTWAACALRGRDEETCIASARWFLREYQYDTDPFRMFAALSRLCPSPASWYASGPVQKYMLRQIKLMDRALTAEAGTDDKDSGDEDGAPTGRSYPSKELDITLLMLYGHILFISNSFIYALNYFQRAYSLDPSNSMVILSVGHCYIHYALKRQAENRQYLITQGFHFLHQYYDQRMASPNTALRQEAHYNLGRSYHAVGLHHLAAEYYHRVFQDVPDDSANGIMGSDDLSREAAYNLQQICWVGGDLEGARAISEKYLVI
ncbi:TPR-like protein [Hypoxylon crocopeplum]|nr:TPR-like protein [Hypoxylon crocopeplum]